MSARAALGRDLFTTGVRFPSFDPFKARMTSWAAASSCISTKAKPREFPVAEFGASGLTFFDDDVTNFFSPHAGGKSAIFLAAVGKSARRSHSAG